MLSRGEATERVLEAKQAKALTFEELAGHVGRHEVWLASAVLGQATMSIEEAGALAGVLGLDSEVTAALQQIPFRGAFGGEVPVDPLLYQFFEIIQVFGPALKAIIHEMFGDGIMSAIDFEIDIERKPDPKGDRVKVTPLTASSRATASGDVARSLLPVGCPDSLGSRSTPQHPGHSGMRHNRAGYFTSVVYVLQRD